jgi:hypothetical protein
VKTRAVFEKLGFREDWEAITDQPPAYYYDFGNLRLTAAEVMSDHFMPCFHFGGVWRDANSISMVDFQMPLEAESFEQAVAWIAYGIGERFRPSFSTPWLSDGRTLRNHLPWVRRMEEYMARPMCWVEKEWFRVAAKKLRPLADSVSASDLVWLSFDGETLRIAGCGATVIVPATGTAWNARYAISARQLDHLPKRLADPVVISVWEGRLTVRQSHRNMTEDFIDVYGNYAIKLLRLQNDMIQTFDRYRRGNKQTVEVRRVHIHSGGQGVVGIINPPDDRDAGVRE